MRLFDNMRGGQFKPGAGVDAPPPTSGFPRFWFVLKTHFGKLILANVLFLLFSIPIITLPASLCGLNSVCIQLMRTGKCFLAQDFFDGFKRKFWLNTLFGIPLCAVIGGTALLYIAEYRAPIFYAAAAAACCFFLVACHFFTLTAQQKGTPLRLFLAAFYLCFTTPATLRLLPALVLALLFLTLHVVFLPVVLTIGISLIVTLAASATLTSDAHLISPTINAND